MHPNERVMRVAGLANLALLWAALALVLDGQAVFDIKRLGRMQSWCSVGAAVGDGASTGMPDEGGGAPGEHCFLCPAGGGAPAPLPERIAPSSNAGRRVGSPLNWERSPRMRVVWSNALARAPPSSAA